MNRNPWLGEKGICQKRRKRTTLPYAFQYLMAVLKCVKRALLDIDPKAFLIGLLVFAVLTAALMLLHFRDPGFYERFWDYWRWANGY